MAVGARDHIDRLLVKKYSELKVDNHDDLANTTVSSEKMLATMQEFSRVNVTMLQLNAKLKNVGKSLQVKSAYKDYKYMPIPE